MRRWTEEKQAAETFVNFPDRCHKKKNKTKEITLTLKVRVMRQPARAKRGEGAGEQEHIISHIS